MDNIDFIVDYIADIRHKIHQNPELSMQEFETTELICRELEAMGAEVIRWDDLTGAVGLIRGAKDGPTVAVRADIDALPIEEASGNPYSSKNKGVMHACGHDAHTAIALGVGKYFAQRRSELTGNVKLIFQPAEEILPGGAIYMIERGVLDNPHVDAIFGLHHYKDYRTGEIGINHGAFLPSGNFFEIKLKVKGGSCSEPHKGVDGIMVAAQIVTSVQVEMTRRINPAKHGLISFSSIHGGEDPYTLASEVTICGRSISFDQETADKIPQLLNDVAGSITNMYGGNVELNYKKGYPVVFNDFNMTRIVIEAAEAVIGAGNVKIISPVMAGDDMAYFLQRVPGCYFLWGITPESGVISPAHAPEFDIDEAAFEPALKVMTAAVQTALSKLK